MFAALEGRVRHFSGEQVAAAMQAGAPLLGEAGAAYQVHATNRTQPGEAEVHQADTDIFFIREGAAVLVVGGELEAPRSIGPSEIRGAGIRGGQTLRLSPGEAIVIPHGVPHWFQRVESRVTYWVVKVRSGASE